MKKFFLTVFVALSTTSAVFAWEFPGFEWSAGADVASAYLWRGMNYGGLTIQPDVTLGYGGLEAEAWANISPKDYSFKELAPELDLTLSYSICGIKVGVTHQYYFDGTKFADYKTPSLESYNNEDYASFQTEVFAEFNLGDIVEDVPLHLGWYTYVSGDDYKEIYADDDETITGIKRAYSTYIDMSYDFGLPLGFTLTPTVGITPWKSFYNYYDDGFAVNNVSLKLNWEYELGDHTTFDVYAIGMLNTAGITKQNAWGGVRNAYSEDWDKSRRLNLAIGIGIWFY